MIPTNRPIQTRFPYGSGCYCLNLAGTINSLTHSSIGTLSLNMWAPTPLWAKNFRIYFTPFPGFFSPFPHGTIRYRCKKVFSLRQWSAQIHAGFHVSDATWELDQKIESAQYTTITSFGPPFQVVLMLYNFVTSACVIGHKTLIPRHRSGNGLPLTPVRFRLFPVRSSLLRESHSISFLLGTEIFHFPSLPPFGTHKEWVSPFGHLQL